MRATILIIDSFGIGEAPDAAEYGDTGANTALHICEKLGGAKWPELARLGLGNASLLLGNPLPGCDASAVPLASFGVMAERSPGKDTTTGHWEIAGIELEHPFHTFTPDYPSFPAPLIEALTKEIGRGVIGNKAASGTVIIEELGEEHVKSGKPIVYTSSDSVFQIAAHEEIIPLDELYGICKIARKLCDPYHVGRVIARPFIGVRGDFSRTKNRRDFSIALPAVSLIEHLQSAGVHTVGIGKIGDIFNEQGLDESFHDKGNPSCLDRTVEIARRPRAPETKARELSFVNLVDTDMVYGHRRDVQGYHDAVAAIDSRLPEIIEGCGTGDLVIISADHGCDPTYRGSDHTREYVPLLVYRKGRTGTNLGIRHGFFDVAQSLCRLFGAPAMPHGASFADMLEM